MTLKPTILFEDKKIHIAIQPQMQVLVQSECLEYNTSPYQPIRMLTRNAGTGFVLVQYNSTTNIITIPQRHTLHVAITIPQRTLPYT